MNKFKLSNGERVTVAELKHVNLELKKALEANITLKNKLNLMYEFLEDDFLPKFPDFSIYSSDEPRFKSLLAEYKEDMRLLRQFILGEYDHSNKFCTRFQDSNLQVKLLESNGKNNSHSTEFDYVESGDESDDTCNRFRASKDIVSAEDEGNNDEEGDAVESNEKRKAALSVIKAWSDDVPAGHILKVLLKIPIDSETADEITWLNVMNRHVSARYRHKVKWIHLGKLLSSHNLITFKKNYVIRNFQ